ncbi:hypothetical protein NW756_001358 [Fusarium oxysporum]|nr:hypothetical protein NW753_005134 [Fusarium oxysporum]KAJ4063839.1 hypothetical protein NW763_004115 [Fusarium oxysporum]KAJ4105585.1 hypothetical protein NW756_001358 [Fusarium oxysporum]
MLLSPVYSCAYCDSAAAVAARHLCLTTTADYSVKWSESQHCSNNPQFDFPYMHHAVQLRNTAGPLGSPILSAGPGYILDGQLIRGDEQLLPASQTHIRITHALVRIPGRLNPRETEFQLNGPVGTIHAVRWSVTTRTTPNAASSFLPPHLPSDTKTASVW